jgi:hypothetical protein
MVKNSACFPTLLIYLDVAYVFTCLISLRHVVLVYNASVIWPLKQEQRVIALKRDIIEILGVHIGPY